MKYFIIIISILCTSFGYAQFNGGNNDGHGVNTTTFDFSSVSVTYIPDNNFESELINLGYDTGVLDDYVPTTNIVGITNLDLNGKGISDLTGIEDFIDLTILEIVGNNISSIDLSKNGALIELSCNNNFFNNLDVTNNIALTSLNFGNNNISNINLSQNSALTDLLCTNNNLSSIDLTANAVLNLIDISSNSLNSLNVSSNTALTTLNCYNNNLTTLNGLNNTSLIELTCTSNQLTSLNVSNVSSLEILLCAANQLTELDLSNNNLLTKLFCASNNLAALNIKNGNNTNISNADFSAQSNNLTCIEVDDVAYSTTNWMNIDIQANFNTNCNSVSIDIKTFLQGAYIDYNVGEEMWMRDNLRTDNLIPTTSPYVDALTCETSVFTLAGANAIVDWVWVELRDENDNTNILNSKSALLQRDGDIVDVDGVSHVSFLTDDGNYFVSVGHRNHLGIIVANTVTLSSTLLTLNLLNNNTTVDGGSNAVVTLGNGFYGLYAGDYDGNGQIQNTDLTSITPLLGQPSGYSNADLDMNTEVQNTDINNLLNPNLGRGQQYARQQDLKLYAKRKK